MARKKCKHGNSAFCTECSKIMMIVCLKNEAKPMYGNRNTLTRYSLLSQDKKPEAIIIDKMTNRLLIGGKENQGECFEGHYNKVIFKDNIHNVIIKTIEKS